MSYLDLDHPFFLPLWRRVLTVAVCLGWALFELSGGHYFWAVIVGAAALYAAWGFFIAWDEEAVRRKRDSRS
jgi:hypothetical protein